MKAKFEEETKKINSLVQPGICNFALEPESSKDVHWDHCREQFAAKFNEKTVGFYFSHPCDKSINICEFLAKFETVMDVSNFSKFVKTQKETVVWIEPSCFWKDCQIKRSLLTLILRCGLNYNPEKDNFDDAIFGQYKENVYLRETKHAMLRFMFGFTKFSGSLSPISAIATVVKHGWREEFLKDDCASVRRKLITPDNIKKETSIIGIEALWT